MGSTYIPASMTYIPAPMTSTPVQTLASITLTDPNTNFVGGTVGIAVGIVVMVSIIVVTISVSIRMYRRRKQRNTAKAQKAAQNQPKATVESSLGSTEHSERVSASSLSLYCINKNEDEPTYCSPATPASFSLSLDYYAAKSSGLLLTGEPSNFRRQHLYQDGTFRSAPKDRNDRSNSHELGTDNRNATRMIGTASVHESVYAAALPEPIENLNSSPRATIARRYPGGAFCNLMPPADRWRSMASADSGLASSLASFADAEHSHPGPISARHSFSSYESLATPAAFMNATVQTTVPPSIACHDGSCNSPSCMRCSKALTALEVNRCPPQQAPDILEESSVGCTLETIWELVRQFEELCLAGQVSVRSVYCTPSFAIADLDEAGGCLITADGSCSLTVPAGALAKRQTIYFGIIYENSSSSDSGAEDCGEANFTPTFECGPNGLRFLKPVQLRTHHCAGPGSDLGQITAFVREGGRTDWSDDSDAGVTYDGENAVLSLTHFTGYKLATNLRSSRSPGAGSRIPRLVPQQPPLMKELYLCSFRCDGKVRVYYMGRDDALYDKIYAQELGLGNTLNSPKKPFSFIYSNGDLLMNTGHGARRRFEVRGVMSNNYDYAELCKIEGVSSFDIEIRQENGGSSSCVIVATFGSRGRSNEFPPQHTFSSEHTLQPLTVSASVAAGYPSRGSDTATLLPTMDRHSSIFARGRFDSTTGRSPPAASPRSGSLSISLASPAESCECAAHGAGAAAEAVCCQSYLCRFRGGRCLSPGEHSDDSVASSVDSAPPPQLNRDRRTRQSKESGYASVTSVAELQGPQTLLDASARGAMPHASFAQPETGVSRGAPDERWHQSAPGEGTAEPCDLRRQPLQLTAERSLVSEDDDDARSRTFGPRTIRRPQPLPRIIRGDSCSS